ncbi:MAG: ABC transporter permease [Promethearchaeota archaeon]|nr:MAG: ABC transporter permease [Candidatus Lokiarchaeota archaeon]
MRKIGENGRTGEFIHFQLRPILETFKFEIVRAKKKFIGFAITVLVLFFLINVYFYLAFDDYELPQTLNLYYQRGIGFLYVNNVNNTALLILFACCFFFGGIICAEYGDKTGFILFPKINKYKLLLGKYIARFTLVILIIAVYYFSLIIGGIYFYWEFNGQILLSLAIAILFILAISAYVTLFSSLTKKENITIVFSIMTLLFGFTIGDLIVQVSTNGEIEPIYSLMYQSNLIEYSVLEDLPHPRYEILHMFTGSEIVDLKIWLTPSYPVAICILLLYTAMLLIFASLIFKRKQL